MDEERFDAIVGLLYEAAMQPERWKPALLALSEAIGGTAGQVVFGDRQTLLPSFSSISGEQHEDANARYGEYFAAHDPRTAKVRESCAGLWMNDAEHFDETFVRHNETYQDFLIPFDYRWVIGTRFEAVDNAEAFMPFCVAPARKRSVCRNRISAGLTPAGARAALALCNGGSIEETAAGLGISANTLKSQLRSIYQKTGVDSRARLVKLVLAGVGRASCA